MKYVIKIGSAYVAAIGLMGSIGAVDNVDLTTQQRHAAKFTDRGDLSPVLVAAGARFVKLTQRNRGF